MVPKQNLTFCFEMFETYFVMNFTYFCHVFCQYSYFYILNSFLKKAKKKFAQLLNATYLPVLSYIRTCCIISSMSWNLLSFVCFVSLSFSESNISTTCNITKQKSINIPTHKSEKLLTGTMLSTAIFAVKALIILWRLDILSYRIVFMKLCM